MLEPGRLSSKLAFRIMGNVANSNNVISPSPPAPWLCLTSPKPSCFLKDKSRFQPFRSLSYRRNNDMPLLCLFITLATK